MSNIGIKVQCRILDSQDEKDIHDRWLFSRNVVYDNYFETLSIKTWRD
ncbi:MAG: hypothetical protein ACUVTB_07120 [Candidatus Bathycorpusculaceae bacterium]